MSQEETKLIQRTLEGDDRAFGFLVDKYKSAVCALAFRKVGNYHDAVVYEVNHRAKRTGSLPRKRLSRLIARC